MSKHYTKHYLTWIKDSKCAEDPESVKDFYADSDDPDELDDEAGQAAISYLCLNCPVMMQCLAHAVKHDEMGIWGGMTAEERARLVLGQGVLKDFE